MNTNAQETYPIPACSWRRANDAQVTDSKSAERLWRNLPSGSGLLETKDPSQKGGELDEYRCARDVPYTAM